MAEETTISDALKQRCFLEGYVSARKETKKRGDGEVQITYFQGDHCDEYLIAETKDGQFDGTVQLFHKGVIQLSWVCVAGKRKGGVKLFHDGVVTQCVNWLSFSGQELAVLENRSDRLLLVIRNPENDVVVYRGEYGEDGVSREGYGFDYDEKTGIVLHYGIFKENKLFHILQEFETATRMIEYEYGSEENVNSLVNRRPVYIGGYLYNETTGFYERHGVGRLIDPNTGIACEENEWCRGKEVEAKKTSLIKGWFAASQLNDDSLRELVGAGKTKNTTKDDGQNYYPKSKTNTDDPIVIRYNISNSRDFYNIPPNVTHLIVGSYCCNDHDIDCFNMTSYSKLRSIIIGKKSFMNVTTVNVSGLNLTTFQIGKHTFRNATS